MVRLLILEFEVREKSTSRSLHGYRLPLYRGHLKRYAERNIGYAKLKDYASNRELLINVLRSNIDHEVAETVFFTEEVNLTVR
jgi:hypothetical protein